MKILFYDTQSYDRESFDRTKEQFPEIEVEYLKTGLAARTASLAKGYDAVCAFVNSDVGTKTVEALHEAGVKLILMRCAGFNNVDLKTAAKYGIDVRRVPGYSPEAVAEHAMTLAMTVNRHMHKAYTKVRENDFSLGGLMGFNFYQKTAGIVGTGKIGAAMARICRGFGMKVIAYDVYQNESLKDFVTYVTLDELLAQSDLISLHCPDDLIEGIRARKFFGVGLDVYEEETPNVFEDRSDEILEHSTTARLLSFPNVMITSHQGFFTEEALRAIAETTLQNALDFEAGKETPNIVRA